MHHANIIVAIQLLTTAIIIVFIFTAKERTNYLVSLYKTNNVQSVDYTMYIRLKKKQIIEFDRIYKSEPREESRGAFLIKLITMHLDALNNSSN